MVTNLVQNAIVHNLPAGGTVTVHTESQHGASVLRVENTGHPAPIGAGADPHRALPAGDRTASAPTSMSASASAWRSCTGSSEHTNGTLDLTPRPTGGLLVTIRLPGNPEGSSPAP